MSGEISNPGISNPEISNLGINQQGISNQGKDVDRLILMQMSDRDLINTCRWNKNMFYNVCDDDFFHRLLQDRYPDTIDIFRGPYKEQYLKIVKWVAKLQEDYNYTYTGDDPVVQYHIFETSENAERLFSAAKKGQLSLVKYLVIPILDSANKQLYLDETLRRATMDRQKGLEIVKYMESQGANIRSRDDSPLITASQFGNLEVMKYLVSRGAHNINALKKAKDRGHGDVVDYLQSLS